MIGALKNSRTSLTGTDTLNFSRHSLFKDPNA